MDGSRRTHGCWSTCNKSSSSGFAISHILRGAMSVVGLHGWSAEPNTQFLQGRDVVLNLPEGKGSPGPRQILPQFGGPGIGLSRAVPHHAAYDRVMQEKIIGASWIRR
jgi:hypothetical protein